jgi:2-polyprenyl-3-methyl-5-hydroxy-6-metoxy-1,4-benzoquinol methylase/tetratricopeptide (TPR) repeat protein
MNRKQRRAAQVQSPPAGAAGADAVRQLLAQAAQFERQRRFDNAARAYKKLLALKPDHAEALNNLGCVLQAQGKLGEASACFARALALTPQLYEQFASVMATLTAVLPPLATAMQRTDAAWPRRPAADELFPDDALAATESDALLLNVLRATPVCDVRLERVLTALRVALLADALADKPASAARLGFACALAQQCFINEYAFATTAEEEAQLGRLQSILAGGGDASPLRIAALAMYQPLSALAGADALLAREAPSALAEVVTQQLREPMAERALRETMPRLTAIDDAVSQRVRAQYEENPFPRWVNPPCGIQPATIDLQLRGLFPTAAFVPLGPVEAIDILIAGCGTGFHPIGMAQRFPNARVLAVDLSLASLAYAKRKTPAEVAHRIDYAQADILKLGGLGRSFHIVDSTGVLHHMAEPLEAWRILLGLTRPGGFMHLGFYSELGRALIVATRAFIAERGYGATAAEIRRFRQDVLTSPYAAIAQAKDYYSTSECRDLLFHVQESRLTIPQLKSFIVAHGLKFIGFEFDAAAQQQYRAQFAQAGWSTSDLDRWHEIETRHPDTFSRMYRLWVQKP